jgi:hypothetical protein
MEQIVTHYWPKPIPLRQFDWEAWIDGDEPDDNGHMRCGHGRTEEEAINNLIIKIRE